jgi:4-hydroxybenzoate polyprenyltransferase
MSTSITAKRSDHGLGAGPSRSGAWLAYAQLVRLPNVFTALADILLGALATAALPERWLGIVLLASASACFYCAGMVWNDFFDVEQDRRERPFRPIPSGRIARGAAAKLGAGLLLGGFLCAIGAGWLRSGSVFSASTGVAVVLMAAILLYDGWLKKIWLGPVGMGLCRFLNVLLGLSIVAGLGWPWGIHLATVIGLYVVGVTWFARTEARASNAASLAAATVVMLVSLLLALPLPTRFPPGTAAPLFPYLLVALGFGIALPASHAIANPTPSRVQRAVKRALVGIVLLDAVLATALAGNVGLLLVLLLVPMLYLGRRLYST